MFWDGDGKCFFFFASYVNIQNLLKLISFALLVIFYFISFFFSSSSIQKALRQFSQPQDATVPPSYIPVIHVLRLFTYSYASRVTWMVLCRGIFPAWTRTVNHPKNSTRHFTDFFRLPSFSSTQLPFFASVFFFPPLVSIRFFLPSTLKFLSVLKHTSSGVCAYSSTLERSKVDEGEE